MSLIVTIPLAPGTARSLGLAIGERIDGPIFRCANGQRLDRHGASRIVRRITNRARITKPISPHILRHGLITATLDAGVLPRDIQEAASHADPRTTMGYDLPAPPSTDTPPTSSLSSRRSPVDHHAPRRSPA